MPSKLVSSLTMKVSISPVDPGWIRTSMNLCEFGHWSCPEKEVLPSTVVMGVLLEVRGFEILFVIPLFDP